MEFFVNEVNEFKKILKIINPGDEIILNDGIYFGKFEILIDNITIKGQNKNKAIFSNKDYYHKIMPNFNECNTFNTFSLYIGGNNITLIDLVIENTATPSSKYGQAVALHVDGNHFKCENCIIKSAQDTLFTGPMPSDLLVRYNNFYPPYRLKGYPSIQEYYNCKIIGDVDFIFGCATALFENCEIISLPHNKNTYICAPSHPKNLEYGYLFYKCNLVSEQTDPYTYLGRPWRDYGCAAFIDCNMGKHILAEGFNKWDGTNRDKTARFYEHTKNENLSNRVDWITILDDEAAAKYVIKFKDFIQKK